MSMLIMFKTIIVYSLPAITLIGLITNSISFVIFSRKRFQNTIFSTYMRIYLVFEAMNLTLPINKMFELNFGIYFGLMSNFLCKFRKFFGNYNYAITPSILVIISFDRYLSIAYPAKFTFRKKPLFQILISCFIIGFNLCLYIPFWFFYLKEKTLNETYNQTLLVITYECVPPTFWVRFINVFQQFLIPFSLMFLFTLLSIRTIFSSRKAASNNSSITKSRDMKFAVSSITINILFLIFSSPLFTLFLINDYSNLFENQSDLYKLIQALFYFLSYFNSTSNFFASYYSNSLFKKEFETLICRKNKYTSTSLKT